MRKKTAAGLSRGGLLLCAVRALQEFITVMCILLDIISKRV